ncbi:30S ribosomal protein S20 [bacterium]|nr:30S ribosomal protein S20 [bacterium]MBU1024409.1 30S ribosomal protein S20 [bacterium]
MAHTKSSIKDLKRIKKRTIRNVALKSRMRTYLTKARRSVDNQESDAAERVDTACQVLDKMVAKGVLKKNNASRRKGRLMKRMNISLNIGKASVVRSEKAVKEKTRKEKLEVVRETIEDVDSAVLAGALREKNEQSDTTKTESESSEETKDDESSEALEDTPEEKPE